MDTFFANRGAYVVLTFAALALPAAAAVVAYFWYKLRKDEMLIILKRDLVERGMSASEICAVIVASPPGTTGVAQDLAALNGSPCDAVSRASPSSSEPVTASYRR